VVALQELISVQVVGSSGNSRGGDDEPEGPRSFVVYVVVDSQNNFGAVLRSHDLAQVMAGEKVDDAREVLHRDVTRDSPTVHQITGLTKEIGTDWDPEGWMKT
jgi:hypothetical protein